MARRGETLDLARQKGFNGVLQAARTKAGGHRITDPFITLIYLIRSPAGSSLKSG
jgi:hypothetical protein